MSDGRMTLRYVQTLVYVQIARDAQKANMFGEYNFQLELEEVTFLKQDNVSPKRLTCARDMWWTRR